MRRAHCSSSVACLVACVAVACADPPAPTPAPAAQATACAPGKAKCHGNYEGRCAADGKAWELKFCGESAYCSEGAGTCQLVVCQKSKRSCSKDGKVIECTSDGSSESAPAACDAGKTCVGGACVVSACKMGEAACGWNALVTCKAGKFEAVNCPAGQFCDPAKKACAAQVCKPTAQGCKTKDALQVCKPDGSAWVEQACAAGQGCYNVAAVQAAVCQTLLKDKAPDGAADAGPTDGGAHDGATVVDTAPAAQDTGTVNTDAPAFLDFGKKEVVLEQADLLKFTLSKTPKPGPEAQDLKFSIASATYLGTLSMLQITGSLGLYNFEMQIAKVEEFEEGEYTTGGETGDKSLLLLNDGTNDQTRQQWKWQSSDYTIKVNKFEDKNGRVKGTFSGQMADTANKANKIFVLDGVFDVERK
ncbi:MAG: hypothetical protein EXR79_04000 [Myxococcales bacterium]|nr:hypothetical protein [Myxococcales bacterium]